MNHAGTTAGPGQALDGLDFASLAARSSRVELGVYPRIRLLPVRASGCYLYDAAGREYLDMYGGHAVALTGHCHPRVIEAICQQARELHYYSNSIHLPVRIEATEMLVEHAPHPGSQVFYCTSGAEANETAMKVARKLTGRRKIVSFDRCFHGRTVATLSASGISSYHRTAGPVLIPDHVFTPLGDVAALERAVDGDTAAILCEPIQSVAGIYMTEPTFYQRMAEIAEKAGALLIVDEVQTAFGRTGSFFFGDPIDVRPDIITMAKGIASGVPCGAVLIAPRWAQQVGMGDQGSTFGGGPIAMAAMKATLQVVEDEGLVENAGRVGALLIEGLRGMAGVVEVRGKGLLLGAQLDRPVKPVLEKLLELGVIAGGAGQPETLRLLPPLTLTPNHAEKFLTALRKVLAAGSR